METRKKILTPPPILNVVEWADTYRYLSPESSSVPGKWKTSTVEPARGPMLEVTNPRCRKITLMTCTQLMKTEFINNVVGYFIHQDPSPMIVMQPTKGISETWSKERFDKMVRDTPVLSQAVYVKGKNDSDNTIYNKTFPGGQLNIVSSGSPSELASRPVRITLSDEIDKYPASSGKEGDPIKLIEERTDTFWNSLNIRACSPTIEGMSRIAEEFEAGDQRTYHGKCPHCGQYEDLIFEQVKYDESDIDNTTYYECSHCSALWNEMDRINAISNGKYIAKKEFKGHASFKVSKLASPWNPLSLLVKKYLDAKDNSEKLKTFYNTQLAETYKLKADSPDHMRLYERREKYNINTVPKEVLFLTAGVDVQGNRLELEIVGWGADKQSWSIDYRVLSGQTSTKEPWDLLDKVINETWISEDKRELKISMTCVDTGFNTQHVYNWLRTHDVNRVRGIKGSDKLQMIFGKPTEVELNHNGQRIPNATRIWNLGVNLLKSELYSWLKMPIPMEGKDPTGYCHYPEYEESYFEGLCSEQLVEVRKNGQKVMIWQKKINRNEPLDCRVYARAGASMLGIDRYNSEQLFEIFGILPENVTKTGNIGDSKEDKPEKNEFWDNSRSNGRNGRGIW